MNIRHLNSIQTSSIFFDSDSKNIKSDENQNNQKKKFTNSFQPHFQLEKTQKMFLEYYYTKNKEPTIQKMLHLSKKLNTPLTKIIQWFKKKNCHESFIKLKKLKINQQQNSGNDKNRQMENSDEYDKNNNLIQKYQSTDITVQKNQKHNSDQNNYEKLKNETSLKNLREKKHQAKSLQRSDIPEVPIKKAIKKSKLKFRDIRNKQKRKCNRISFVLSNFRKKSHKVAKFRYVKQSKSQDNNFNYQNNSNSDNSLQNEIQSCPLYTQQIELLQQQKLKNIKNHVLGNQAFQPQSGYQMNNQENNNKSQNMFLQFLLNQLQQLDHLFCNHLQLLEKLKNDQNFVQSLMQNNFSGEQIPHLIYLVTELFNLFQKSQEPNPQQQYIQQQNTMQINQQLSINESHFNKGHQDFLLLQQQQKAPQNEIDKEQTIKNLIQQIIPNPNFNPNNLYLIQMLKSNSENLISIIDQLRQYFEEYFQECQ